MSNYKDFSTFNRDADDIRPTGRIQLIQRILNAASLISTLSAGVPLKWANAYKSFQVLKPVSNADPVDVTTPEAVSAVDSVLYEAHSQLRASWDDLRTLRSELEKMPLVGKASWAAYPKWPARSYILIAQVAVQGEPCCLCLYTDDESDLHNSLFIMRYSYFSSLANTVVADGSNSSIYHYQIADFSGRNVRSISGRVSSSGDSDVYDFSFLTESANNQCTVRAKLIQIHFDSENSAHVYPSQCFQTISTAPGASQELTYSFDAVTSSNGMFEGLAPSQSLTVLGSLDSEVALGLPDPSAVIADIENLL
jgi:hypothetical protein